MKYLNNNDWEFPQVNVKHQTTDQKTQENTKEAKCKIKLHLGMVYSNCRKLKKKYWKKAEGETFYL